MASAIMRPTSSSLPAEMVPTWAMALESEIGLACSSIFLTRNSEALSMPFLRVMALAPAATLRRPAFTMAWASTVAVVVPSPAASLVLEAA